MIIIQVFLSKDKMNDKNGQKVITDNQPYGEKMNKKYDGSNTYYKHMTMWFDSTF